MLVEMGIVTLSKGEAAGEAGFPPASAAKARERARRT
jgi:hypothetical protein